MTIHQTIKKEKSDAICLDFDALYKEGIKWIEQYSGDLWTDYNTHDPGITLLEYLCFGITDVGYRCHFPVTDLLFSQEKRQFNLVDNTFFPLDKIMPCAPLTTVDYRRLLLDQLPVEVDNIWVHSLTTAQKSLDGLYQIVLQLNAETTEARTPEQQKKYTEDVIKEVRKIFMAHRNLCEDIDIHSIEVLQREELSLKGTISIGSDVSGEQVLADLVYQMEQLLAPRPKFYSFSELTAAGKTVNEILDGPSTMHGWINKEELKSVRSVFSTTELSDVIRSVSGVQTVEINISINGVNQPSGDIPLEENTFFELDDNILKEGNENLRFFRNEQRIRINVAETKQILLTYKAREHQGFKDRSDIQKPTPVSEKDLSEIAHYYSIQRLFPAVYGIGAYGLPRHANTLRQAQAQQLKGYLAVLETMFAGYLKQLTQLRNLFSTGIPAEFVQPNEETKRGITPKNAEQIEQASYFAQFPFDIPDILPLINTSEIEWDYDELPNIAMELEEENRLLYTNFMQKINQQLVQFTEINEQSLQRRNLFLDHLLARFGETFNSDLLYQMSDATDDNDLFLKKLIEAKCRILQQYGNLSQKRGVGFNYWKQNHLETEEGIWKTSNVSWLKKQICMRLNLPVYDDQSLTDYFPFDQCEPPQSMTSEKVAAMEIKPLSLRYGDDINNYEIILSQLGGNYYELWFREKSKPPILVLSASSKEEAAEKRDEFIEKLAKFKALSNNFYVIEHILLRPQTPKFEKVTFSIPLNEQTEQITFESLGEHDSEQIKRTTRNLVVALYEDKKARDANESQTDTIKYNYTKIPFDGLFFLLIYQNKQPLVASKPLYSEAEADKLIKNLRIYMDNLLENTPQKIDDFIEIKEVGIRGELVKDSFYTNRISIVAPAWGGIGVNQERRGLFKNLVHQLAPAHLHIDFFWLNWEEMKDFEPDYKNWLLAQSEPTDDFNVYQDRLEKTAFQVLKKLIKNNKQDDKQEEKFKSLEKWEETSINEIVATKDIKNAIHQFFNPS
jgi:hypothetical protein